jgi:FkbM family methyltransferase
MISAVSSIEEQVDDLLQEGCEGALRRERSAFDQAVEPAGAALVLFGAGRLGRKTLAALRTKGIEPLAFCDNNARLWGRPVDGVPVFSPVDAAARFGRSAAFVVTVWGVRSPDRMSDRVAQLRSLGCESVTPFPKLFWKYSELLPYHVIDLPSKVQAEAAEVLAASKLWSDDFSRQEYLAQLRWRLLADFDRMADPDPAGTYFPEGLIQLHEHEVFADCGAYDGDTVEKFLRVTRGNFERIVAFEPDPGNLGKLREAVNRLTTDIERRIEWHPKAVGASDCRVRFAALGTDGSAISAEGLEVECVTLDSVFEDQSGPTFIKMDIEGAELDALAGARRTLERYAPALAICSYHRQSDLWRIPRLIHSINPGYRLFLRPHLADGWDLVCYAIPPAGGHENGR